jgi:hypothetical protein
MTHAPWHSGGGGTFTGQHPDYVAPSPSVKATAPTTTQELDNMINRGDVGNRKFAAQSMLDAGIASIGGKPIGGTLAGKGGKDEGKFTIGAGDTRPGIVTPPDDTTPDKKTFGERWRSFIGLPPDKWKKGMTIPGFEEVGEVSQSLYNKIYQLREAGVSPSELKRILNMGVGQDTFSDENLQSLSEAFGKGELSLSLPGILLKGLQKPDYENEFLGSAGAANILNKLKKITDPEERQEYVNRILAANKGAEEIFGGRPFDLGEQITPEDFEQGLVAANQGNKNFDKAYGPETYYTLNPPRTQDDLEDARAAGITYIPGFGPVDPDPKTRYTGLGSFMGEEPWVGDRSADEYRQQVSYGTGVPSSDPTPDPDDPMIPVDPVPYPGTTPTIPTIPKYPSSVITDYTQLGLPNIYGNQQTNNYANFNQPVGLKDYLENLRQRFGIG